MKLQMLRIMLGLLMTIVIVTKSHSVTLKTEKQFFEKSISVKKYAVQTVSPVQRQVVQLQHRQVIQRIKEHKTIKVQSRKARKNTEKLEVLDDDEEPHSNTLCDNVEKATSVNHIPDVGKTIPNLLR